MHIPGFFRTSSLFSITRVFSSILLVLFCLGYSTMGQAVTPSAPAKKPTVSRKTTKRSTKSTKQAATKAHIEIRAQDTTGTPASISGMQVVLRRTNNKKAKPITGPSPLNIWLSPGSYNIQVVPPKGIEALKHAEAASYLQGQISQILISSKQGDAPIIVKVAKNPALAPKTTPQPVLPVASDKPIPPPVMTHDPGKGTVIFGVDSKTPLAFEQMSCFVDAAPQDCFQFFSIQGMEFNPGLHTFVIQRGPFSASATQMVEKNQTYNILFKLTGKVTLTLSGPSVKAVQVKVWPTQKKESDAENDNEPPLLTKEVSLPYAFFLPAGEYKVQVVKEGYQPFIVSQMELPPFEMVKIPVHMVDDPEYQEKMCGLCARNNGKQRTTLLLSAGTPDYISLQGMFGVADFTKHVRLDVGLRLNSSYYMTTVGAVTQVQFVNFPKFSMAGRLYLGGGGGPDSRTNVTFEVGPVLTFSPVKSFHISLSPYFQAFRDTLPPSSDPMNSIRDQTGYRAIISLSPEVSLNRFLNFGLELQWAPGTHRKAFTSEYNEPLYPKEDNLAAGGFYGRVTFTVKFPPFISSIQ